MSENKNSQDQSQIGQKDPNQQQQDEHHVSTDKNTLYPAIQQPQHTVQDDIMEFNQQIQKKRNSQRKSVFSNHEEQNLTHLIQQCISESKQEEREKNENESNKNDIENKQSGCSSNKTENYSSTQVPEKPKHTVQDDIKELTGQIEIRRNTRRASQFAVASQTHVHEGAESSDHKHIPEKNKENNISSENESDDDENDDMKIESLNNLEKKKKQKASDQNAENNERTSQEQIQKSINELEEEAKKKPNPYNEIIKLNNEITVKRELKRKSTFSAPKIEDEDLEEENQKRGCSSNANQKNKDEKHNQEHDKDHIKSKQNAFNEIIKLNNEIHVKNDLKRKSTFSMPTIQDDDFDKPKSVTFKDSDDIQEEPALEDKGDSSDQPIIPAEKKHNPLDEIIQLTNEIKVKRQLSRRSTFSVPVIVEQEDEQKQQPECSENDQNKQNKPNALNEIIQLNNDINAKKKLSRKSTFQLEQHESDDEEKESEEKDKKERENRESDQQDKDQQSCTQKC